MTAPGFETYCHAENLPQLATFSMENSPLAPSNNFVEKFKIASQERIVQTQSSLLI